MVKKLSDKSQEVYDLICKVGCLTVSQVSKIDRAENPETTVKFLHNFRYIKLLAEKYCIPFGREHEDMAAVACMWAFLSLITTDEGINREQLETLINGSSIVNFSYIHNDSMVVNLVYLDSGYTSKMAAINQRFYDLSGVQPGHEKEAGIVYVYVVDDKEVLAGVLDKDIKIPHKIAFIDGDLAGYPEVKFM